MQKNKRVWWLSILFMLMFLSGLVSCNSDSSSDNQDDWTILVYMAADNNLEMYGIGDLNEMLAVKASDKVNIIVLADRGEMYANQTDSVGGVNEWTSAKLFKVEPGNLVELDDWGEVDMGSKDIVARFIERGIKDYPAKRIMLDFWDHGAAWQGFCEDISENDDILTLSDLKLGVSEGLKAASLDKIDLLGFDACLMSSIEVAQTVSKFAEYMMASEETEPGHGWYYTALNKLVDSPSMEPQQLAQVLMEGYVEQATAMDTLDEVTVSVLDLSKMDDLIEKMDKFFGRAKQKVESNVESITHSVNKTVEFGKSSDPELSQNLIDLGSFVDSLAGVVTDYSSEAKELTDVIDSMVVASRIPDHFSGISGISIYFPLRVDYYHEDYEDVEGMSTWRDFMYSYWNVGKSDLTSPKFINTENEADLEIDYDHILISGTLDTSTTKDLVEVSFNYSYFPSENIEYELGWRPAEYDSATGVVSYDWDLQAVKLVQGDKRSWVYYQIDKTQDENIDELWMPLAYVKEDAEEGDEYIRVEWVHLMDKRTKRILSKIFYQIDDDNFSELQAEEGYVFYPLVYMWDRENYDNSDWVILEDAPAFDATKTLDFTFAEFPENYDIGFFLYADDIMGNWDYVEAYVGPAE